MLEAMTSTAVLLATAGLGLSLIGWIDYLRRIAAGQVPRRPWADGLAMAAGAVLAIVAVGWAVGLGPWAGEGLALGVVILAGLAVGLAGFFAYLIANAALPDGELIVRVGDPLPAFASWTHTGEPFASASLAGDRVLLKFFRGHW